MGLNPDSHPIWICIMHECRTPMHADPAKPNVINPKFTVTRRLQLDLPHVKAFVWPRYFWLVPLITYLVKPDSGNQLAVFHSSPPLTCADLPRSSPAPLCFLVSEPNSVPQWYQTCKVSPLSVSSLSTCFSRCLPTIPLLCLQ